MAQVIERLRPYLLGWKACYGLAQTPRVWLSLDEWLGQRLQARQPKHCRCSRTIYRERITRGATEQVTKCVAGNCRSWWRSSDGEINRVLTIAYVDTLG